MRYRIALMALAMVCIVVAPAFSAPDIRHEGCPFLANNLSEKELNNMTFGQLQEMMLQVRQNETPCQAKGWRQDRGEGGFDHDGNMAWGMPQSTLILSLMDDDVSVDKLNNMTANQIEVLQQKKMDELNNMTVNQIRELQQKRRQDNMTWNELQKENRKIRQISEIMDWAHCRA
ncbi:Uncharacterised protein [uncultured archaeon]|nr:Uncharacterised protein [uncultured archaeon]